MPGAKKPRYTNSSLAIAKARSHAREVKKRDEAQRAQAVNILSPDDIRGGYDAGRALITTFGGEPRELTSADLVAFRRNIKTLGKKFDGGITAKQVINLSLPIDRERANKEIRSAVPVWARKGVVHFLTNAGPNSEDTRHHVDVILLNHPKVLTLPKEARALSRLNAEGALKFDCDCGRHRFWYRYISTVGKFNAGRDETGFPKIRNPKLAGVACKHVLRVMKQLGTIAVLNVIGRMIEADRRALETGKTKAVTLTEKQAKELAEKQARESGHKKNTIVTQRQRAARLRLRAKIRGGAIQRKKVKTVADMLAADRKSREAMARYDELAANSAITQSEYRGLVTALKAKLMLKLRKK